MEWLEKITGKIIRRLPVLESKNDLLNDLIDDALRQIVIYENANSYDVKWDALLVNCVVTLYNYEGVEGSIERRGQTFLDKYDSSSILTDLLSRNITPYVRPIGYRYSNDRFDLPK